MTRKTLEKVDTIKTMIEETKNGRGRPRKKPGYDRQAEIEELITTACDLICVPLDDREVREPGAPSLSSVAEQMNTTLLRARKLLISGGMYSSGVSRRVQQLYSCGVGAGEIMQQTGLSKASVYSYLPYSKGAYNLENPTLFSEQGKRYRERKKAVVELGTAVETGTDQTLALWKCIIAFQGYPFTTSGRGKDKTGAKQFTYEVSTPGGNGGLHYNGETVDGFGNELWIIVDGERKEKSISRSTVDRAFQTVMKLNGLVTGPKKLSVPGAHSYLYAIFLRFGVINTVATPTTSTEET